MIAFLKLIKLDNLLMIAMAQLCIKYGLFQPFDIAVTLNGFGIALIIIATLTIGAAGNILIELYNKERTIPENVLLGVISEKSANSWFMTLNITGVLIGFYIANLIEKPMFAALFIMISGVFYMYASYIKEIMVLKNIVIAILISLSLIAIGIFDLLPAITDKNRAAQTVIFAIVLDYALFAFVIITIRELIKDCWTLDRDHNAGIKTVPIVLGKNRTLKLISVLTMIPIALVVYYIYTYLFSNTLAVVYVLILLIAPLLYCMFTSWHAKTNSDFKELSPILKIMLFLTSLSLLFYQFILE